MNRLNGKRITKARQRWTPEVDAGRVSCRRCHEPIHPGQPWDLGHAHDLILGGSPAGPMAPEHRLRMDCAAGGNRAAGARLGALVGGGRPRRRLAEWIKP